MTGRVPFARLLNERIQRANKELRAENRREEKKIKDRKAFINRLAKIFVVLNKDPEFVAWLKRKSGGQVELSCTEFSSRDDFSLATNWALEFHIKKGLYIYEKFSGSPDSAVDPTRLYDRAWGQIEGPLFHINTPSEMVKYLLNKHGR